MKNPTIQKVYFKKENEEGYRVLSENPMPQSNITMLTTKPFLDSDNIVWYLEFEIWSQTNREIEDGLYYDLLFESNNKQYIVQDIQIFKDSSYSQDVKLTVFKGNKHSCKNPIFTIIKLDNLK